MSATVTRRSRRLKGAAAAALALAAAVACSEPPTTGGAAAVDPDDLPECPLGALEEADRPVRIDMWFGGLGGTTQQVMEDMATRFNASQDDIVVTASDQGDSYAEVYRDYESASAASTEQLPDVIYLEDIQLQAMIDGGQVLPAQSCMEADGYDLEAMEPVVRSAYTVDEVLYPAYMNVSTPILYYNRAHWARAGLDPNDPPDTLDELYDAAVALRDAGVSERPFSFKLGRWFFESWMTGLGVDLVNNGNGRDAQATESQLDTPEARELLVFLRQMQEEGLLNAFANVEGSIDHFLALVNQQSSMLIETSAASPTIRDALGGNIDPDEAGGGVDASALDLSELVPGTGPLPGIEEPGQVQANGGVFYILNTSSPAQQAASWRFLRFMLEPDNAQEWYVNGGYLPVQSSTYEEPDVQAFARDDVAGVLLQASYDQLQQSDPDQPGPLVGPYSDFADTVEQAMEAVVLDGADPADALAEADATVTEFLQRYAG